MRLDLSTIGFSVLASGIFGCQNSSETTVATPQWIQANACNMDTIRREHPPYRVVVEGDDVRTTPYTETISTDRDPSVAGIQSLQEANKNLPFLFCVDANSQQGNHFATYGFSSARRNFYLGNLPSPPSTCPTTTYTPPDGMIAVRQDEYDELRRAQNERSNHSLWLGGLGAIIALGVGIGRVVEARRRNMIEMAKAGSFHEADWEGWLRWILPDRFYTSLNLMNAKANPTSVEPLTLEDDHH